MVRQIFKEIIRLNEFTPEDWKKVTIKVIHKKGDVGNVSNYHPICSLLALYKLLPTILYGRLYPVLDQKQAEDQAGFRKSYKTTDHFADVTVATYVVKVPICVQSLEYLETCSSPGKKTGAAKRRVPEGITSLLHHDCTKYKYIMPPCASHKKYMLIESGFQTSCVA